MRHGQWVHGHHPQQTDTIRNITFPQTKNAGGKTRMKTEQSGSFVYNFVDIHKWVSTNMAWSRFCMALSSTWYVTLHHVARIDADLLLSEHGHGRLIHRVSNRSPLIIYIHAHISWHVSVDISASEHLTHRFSRDPTFCQFTSFVQLSHEVQTFPWSKKVLQFYRPQTKFGKVMFSQASGGIGYRSYNLPLPQACDLYPTISLSNWYWYLVVANASPTFGTQAVRILLECCLVSSQFT